MKIVSIYFTKIRIQIPLKFIAIDFFLCFLNGLNKVRIIKIFGQFFNNLIDIHLD